MAKNDISLLTPLKTIFSSSYVNKQYPLHILILFGSMFLFLTSILSGFKAIMTNASFMINFITVFIALPILLLFTYTLIHLFISSFEKHKKKFSQGYLLFSGYILPLIALGHLLNIIQASTYNVVVQTSIAFLIVIIFLSIIGITIRNTKTFFSTTYAKSLSSIILTAIVICVISILIFLSYLISILQQTI